MCVGSLVLRMARFVLLRISLNTFPEWFVVLQLKSVCLALKSPIMMVWPLLSARAVINFPEGVVLGGQYIVAIRRAACPFRSTFAAVYSLLLSSSLVRSKTASEYSIPSFKSSATPPLHPSGRSFLRMLKPGIRNLVLVLRKVSLIEAMLVCFSRRSCISSRLFLLMLLMLTCKTFSGVVIWFGV